MKQIFIIILLFLASSLGSKIQAQSSLDVYHDKYFYMPIPKKFKEAKIYNAPHMRLKLSSGNIYFGVSVFNNNYPEDMDAWSDQIYQRFQKPFDPSSLIVSCKKKQIKLASGSVKCLVVLANNKTLPLRIATFLIVHQGNLFFIALTSPGKYTKNSSTDYPESIIKTIHLKTNENSHFNSSQTNKSVADKAADEFLSLLPSLNKQLPINIDEYTKLMAVYNVDKKVFLKYKVDFDSDMLTQDERNEFLKEAETIIKRDMQLLFTRGIVTQKKEDFSKFLEATGISMNMVIVDINSTPVGRILLNFSDFK